ncbi:MAG: hypothetical protein EOP06_09355 [Proteobacteria bacterium]|nr:MAG: hypothetical protein EOP06_09355 [Pseudomonadota bacterium]
MKFHHISWVLLSFSLLSASTTLAQEDVQSVVVLENLQQSRELNGRIQSLEIVSCDTRQEALSTQCFGELKMIDSHGRAHSKILKRESWFAVRSMIGQLASSEARISTVNFKATCRKVPEQTPVLKVLQTNYDADGHYTQQLVTVLKNQDCTDAVRTSPESEAMKAQARTLQSGLLMLASEAML